jgi:hypothetical protein
MKKLITILLLFVLQNSFGQTTYYVSTTGSNTNAGTQASPFATSSHAASVAVSGDSIIVGSGTFIETTPIVLSGVVWKGAGKDVTIIKSHYVTDWNQNNPSTASVSMVSASQGSVGHNKISDLTLDGDGYIGTVGILIKRQSYDTIQDCNIKGFFINGITLIGADDPYTKPTTYSVGNFLQRVLIDDCTDTAETYHGGGLINYAGQKDFHVWDSRFADTSRAEGRNGDIVVGNKYSIGTQFLRDTSYKPSTNNAGWNFHYETPAEAGGFDLDSCLMYGGDYALDIGGNVTHDLSYPYTYHVHNCTFDDSRGYQYSGTYGKYAIQIEGPAVENVLVENNVFKNIVHFFSINDGGGTYAATVSNVVFRNNVGIGMGQYSSSYYGNLIEVTKTNSGGWIKGLSIINNTAVPNSLAHVTFAGVTNSSGCTINNMKVGNNIFENGTNGYWMTVSNSGTFDTLEARNNLLYNNDANTIQFTGTVTHQTFTGTISTNPLLNSDGSLQSGSPAIGAAYPYGYGSDIGALQYTTIAPPTISVSGNQPNVTLDHTSVSAVGTPAPGQTITGYSWTKTSGAAVTFGTPNSASTTVTGLTTGTYILRCTVTQSDGQTAYGDVTITVNIPAPPGPPNAYIKLRLPTKFINK